MFAAARNYLEKKTSCVLVEEYITAVLETLKTIVIENYIAVKFSH
jgi:hypothetical protein